MLCPSCGKEVAQTDATCGFCGSALSPEPHSSAESLPSADVAAPPGGLELSPRKSGKAIASLIFGLFPFVPWVGLLSFVFGSYSPHLTLGLYPLDFVAAVVAIILGHRAKAAIRLSGGQFRERGIAIAGLALAYLWLAGSVLVMGISAFIANSQTAANQASAVGSLRIINVAAKTYAQTYNRGFPPALAALGPPIPETSNASPVSSEKGTGLIDDVLAMGTKLNYRFTYVAGPVDSRGKIQTYTVRADPTEPGKTGKRHYFTDQTGVIRFEEKKEADQNSPPRAD